MKLTLFSSAVSLNHNNFQIKENQSKQQHINPKISYVVFRNNTAKMNPHIKYINHPEKKQRFDLPMAA